jgi:segregation and condensation protein A
MESVTIDPNRFAVKTEVFEGPLELLIELVEKRKLLINDISLAEVTDEYMQRVSLMQELSLPNTVQFVTLAATLLLIKSKSLLPVLELTDEEEESIEDLQDRLKQYQLYRDAAVPLSSAFGQTVLHEPRYTPPREPLFVPDTFCTTSELQEAMKRVLHNLPREAAPKVKATVRQTISLEDMMSKLQKRIEQQMKTRFSELRRNEPEHKNVIVGFLAILELFKQGDILITQGGRYEDIHMESSKASIPKYYQ